jgi:molybdopterin-guanine dinucleotide biosynthesis protein A
MIRPEQITGLILAGGRGTRMGNIDKGMQSLRGYPMVMHVLLRLAPQVGHVLVSANQNLDAYRSLGHPVITDLQPDLGPIGGLQAALEICTTKYLLTAPCDTPLLPTNLAARLGQALMDQQADAAVVTTGPWLQPLFCLMHIRARSAIETFLDQGGRKADGWHAAVRIVKVPFDQQADAFVNINTLEELASLGPAAGKTQEPG